MLADDQPRPGTVTVYSQKSCHACHATLRWLASHSVVHSVVDIDAEPGAREQLRALGYTSAPVVVTASGESWSGFRDRLLAGLLVDGADDTALVAGS